MPYMELDLPPGLYRNGTEFQSRNRWYDGDLVRWYQGTMQPIGGWTEISFTGNDIVTSESGTTGWAGDTPGSAPANWTEVQNRGSDPDALHDWTVETDASALLGQVLYMPDRNNVYVGSLLWDEPAVFADGEVLVEVIVPNTNARVGISARHNGTKPTTAIFCYLYKIGSSVYLYTSYGNAVVDGSDPAAIPIASQILTAPAPTTGEYWQIRFNFDGTAVKAKAWETGTSEPGAWQIDTTNGTMTTAAGQVGTYAGTPITVLPQSVGFLAYAGASGGTASTPSSGTSTVTPAATDIGGQCLGALAWRDNDNVPWLALGTPTQCWIYSEGLISDVTPAGFTTGLADGSTSIAGYGTGAYGAGIYGTGVASSVGTVLEAQSWQFDTFGEVLVAVAHSDGNLYSFTPNTDTQMQPFTGTGLPTNNKGVVVTPERFVVALGADNDPRQIIWADQESLTVWAPTPENQAGDFILPGSGTVMCGTRAQRETLIWTNQDLFTMQFIGGSLIYAFEQPGTNCGIIGRRAYAMLDGSRAMWMGTDSFFMYDGRVVAMPSEVGDDVFNDINSEQASKIFALVFSEFSEIWFFYPSTGSTDVDKYVSYNFAEGHWGMGNLKRTAGVPRGSFAYPIMADKNGLLYDHERGTTYYDLDGVTSLVPSAKTGPIDIAQGDNTMWVRYIIPDENTLGDVNAYLYSRLYPTATEATFGPFTLAEPTSTRMSGRQVSLEIQQVSPGWRVGVMRLEVVPAGMR